ncbi:MAG: tryptophan 7-halogenase [Candidatus Omnitrophica bacterium]|nr:tryptophan 7-halogenase [Candidatus Omnitrophota bacterium]
MVTCDYLIIGAGFAGIGLKYKLLGKTILIDKKPFQYKIGESHVPTLINEDPGLISLIPKIVKMKSFTRKLGTIFCDSYHGRYASHFPTALGRSFAFHCERQEIEELLAKELSVDIRQETILDIDLAKNTVKTDHNTYRFTKYILDCSGPAMVLANKLNLVTPVDQFAGMKAQWSYWAIDSLNREADSWANWTVINKIAADSWIWQIPIYRSSILSMGLLHRGEPLSEKELFEYTGKHAAACWRLTSIARNPGRAIAPYMKEVHCRPNYSRRSRQCTGANWILIGDACCFADPVYSAGSGVAMLEALTVADNLNKNKGQFDHQWYDRNCNALINTLVEGIGTWYSGSVFNKGVNERINRTILRGGFSRHFKPSPITERAKHLQQESEDTFLPRGISAADRLKKANKIYYVSKGSLGRLVRIADAKVRQVFEQHVVDKKLSFSDLYRLAELKLRTNKDRAYFWKIVRFIELKGQVPSGEDRLYYFHPDQCVCVAGELKLGSSRKGLTLTVKDPLSIRFFEQLSGKILSGQELTRLAQRTSGLSTQAKRNIVVFLKMFQNTDVFGQYFCLKKK